MEVLVSGYNGFVGKNLIESLGNNQVHVLSRNRNSTTNTFRSAVTWRELSLHHLKDIDAIIHLAGKAHDLKNTTNPEEYFHVNTDLTIKLFDLFLESKTKDFIYFSSVKAVADTVEVILTETVKPEPKTPYGQSKLKAEEYLMSKSLPEGKRLFILRPCMIHGPGNKGNLNLLYQVVKRGIPYPLAAFENKRSFLSIDNLTFIIEQLLKNPGIPGGIYNVADDEPLSTREVIMIMGQANNTAPKLCSLSPALIKFAASIGDKLRLPLNSERLKKLTESYVVDNNKIKAAIGVDSLPVSSRNGLLTTITSFE
ncbi:NAD-dependent epimerase/dehydratase family protein [Pontibacter populi]|uniref:NAD-dependent epimerase/dehydratase family protein n=1 Tax=Pontibacter populi TaxID=890055 RepID=A0ABV1RVS5_9BACT